MIKISSSTTFVMKRVFPIFWFGCIGIFLLANLLGGLWRKAPAFLLIPLIPAGFGFFLLKILVWDLVDEVYDCGDHLLIRNAGEEDSVRLADIINVNSSFFVNPPAHHPAPWRRLASSAPTSPFRRPGSCSGILSPAARSSTI